MKFQKGLLDDVSKRPAKVETNAGRPQEQVRGASNEVDDRLFQTHRRTTRSWQQYLKLLGIVSILVITAGGVIFYLTLPRFGDKVGAPKGLEDAVRTHFVDVEKRTTGDIDFYFCDNYYWARVNVEKRPDIKTNPVYQIGTYTARATGNSETGWKIAATPLTSADADQPCK